MPDTRDGKYVIKALVVGALQTNCYLVGCRDTGEGAVIDPGDEGEKIVREAKRLGLKVRYVLNTHAHFDHIGANGYVIRATGAEFGLHPDDLPVLEAGGGATLFGWHFIKSPPPSVDLAKSKFLELGNLKLEVLHTPGHSPGHVTFYAREAGVLFDGDVLFNGGIGRTDLPGGSFEVLMRSIKETLFAFPDETKLYPGHGPETTIGDERGWL